MNYKEEFLQTWNDVKIYTDSNDSSNLETLKNIFKSARKNKNQIFFIGNGGSAAIAEHMSTDYLKNGHMRTVNLFSSSMLTCLSNDYGYEHVFSKQLELNAEVDDLLIAISSSGNSPNIVNAVAEAKKIGMKIITFTGFDANNKICHEGNYNLHVPNNKYGIVESIHNLILQQILDEINDEEVD